MPDISALISALPPEIAKTAKLFQELLAQDQTVQARVLDVLPNGNVFLSLQGQTLLAKTALPLTQGENITAKVTSLKPNLVLTLLPEPSRKASDPNAALPDLKSLRDTLVKMNVLPTQDSLTAAKAYMREGLPLQPDAFKAFLNNIKDLGISNSKDLAMAAKLQRFSLPLTTPLLAQMKEIFSGEAGTPPSPAVNEWIAQIKDVKTVLPQSLLEKINLPLQNIETMMRQAQAIPQSDPKDIQTALQNNAQTTPYAFEKKILGALSENFVDPKAFSEKLPDLLQLTRQAIQQTEKFSTSLDHVGNNPFSILKSLEKEFLLFQKILPEKSPSDSSLLSESASTAPKILRVVHLLDQLRAEVPSSMSLKTPEFSKTMNEIHSMFQSFFPEKTSVPPLPETLPSSPLQKHPTVPESPDFSNPPNLKEEILKIAQSLKEHLSSSNPAQAAQIQRLHEETENLLNQILQKQFLSHSADDSIKMQALDVPWAAGGKPDELNLFFKQQNTSGKNGNPQKSFQVFFSMDLSHLGHFEINIHDIQQNLEVSFASADETVSAFFKRNSLTLKEALDQPPVKSVNVKTSTKKKPASPKSDFPWPPLTFKTPFRIDLTG